MQYEIIAGQQQIKNQLMQISDSQQVAHGYLLEGPKGMRKTTLAKIFAQTLLCQKRTDRPCDSCSSCIKANGGNHPDIQVMIFEADTIKRQDLDHVIQWAYTKPYESQQKIMILQDIQKMTPQGANTFLKTLEEPPENTVLILTTTQSSLLLPTIVSRCQVIRCEKNSRHEVAKWLQEKHSVTALEASVLAGYSKGVIQRAISIKEGTLPLLDIREEVLEVIDQLLFGGKSAPFEVSDYFEKRKDQIETIVELMMIWFRDLLYVKMNGEEWLINQDKLVLLHKHSKKTNKDKCVNIIDDLQQVYEDITGNVNFKLAIDHLLFKIQEVKHD
jgi:DNA polymerase-3 subunit delta'